MPNAAITEINAMINAENTGLFRANRPRRSIPKENQSELLWMSLSDSDRDEANSPSMFDVFPVMPMRNVFTWNVAPVPCWIRRLVDVGFWQLNLFDHENQLALCRHFIHPVIRDQRRICIFPTGALSQIK